MTNENLTKNVTSSSLNNESRTNSIKETAFDKIVQLFKINGIIYGSSVCRSLTGNISITKKKGKI